MLGPRHKASSRFLLRRSDPADPAFASVTRMAQLNVGESGKRDAFNPTAVPADESVGSVTGERWVGMSSNALVGVAAGAGPTEDRIDVTDDQGRRIGWVDPRTGARTLLAADRAAEFDEMVDFWLFAAPTHQGHTAMDSGWSLKPEHRFACTSQRSATRIQRSSGR